MTRYLDKLNLRPQERRLVIFVAVVVFVALNWFFVKPYFGELGRTQQRMKDADATIKKFDDEIQKKPLYQKQKDQLSQQGQQVATEEMALSLTREVNNQAGAAGVNYGSLVLVSHGRDVRTNAFFEEQTANMTFANTGEPELINFLYSLASQKSLIRVKSMVLRPDPGRMKLGGTITLIESFQKKKPAKAAAPASAQATAAKPAATPPKPAPPPAQAARPPPKPTNLPVKATVPPPRTNTLKQPFPPPPAPK
jgi:hypothetical protein